MVGTIPSFLKKNLKVNIKKFEVVFEELYIYFKNKGNNSFVGSNFIQKKLK